MNESKDYTKLFVIYVYAWFWFSILLTGGVMLFFGEKTPMQLLTTICSWTPTIVLLIMFKKLRPHTTRKDFFKSLFKTKINWRMLLTVTVIQLFLTLASISLVSFQKKVSIISLVNLSVPMLSYAFFTSLITGATGEESAWRGYLFPIMVKKSGVIRGSILLGLIWGFWHLPLWFATSGFAGLDLVMYIVAFMISIVSVSVIIGICYNHNRNLVIPIWIHLIYNFSMSLYGGKAEDLVTFFLSLTLLYGLIAFAFYFWHKRNYQDK